MICKLAEVQHDFVANKFTVQSFGQEIFVDSTNYTITSYTALGEKLLHGLGHFFDLAIRITSYNVCYTKLLRSVGLKFATSFQLEPSSLLSSTMSSAGPLNMSPVPGR